MQNGAILMCDIPKKIKKVSNIFDEKDLINEIDEELATYLLRENSNQPRKLLKVRSHISLDHLGIATIQKEGAEMNLRFVEM